MELANSIAVVATASAASFAVALLMNWIMLRALFHLLPRPRHATVFPPTPGKAHPEPGRLVPVRPLTLSAAIATGRVFSRPGRIGTLATKNC